MNTCIHECVNTSGPAFTGRAYMYTYVHAGARAYPRDWASEHGRKRVRHDRAVSSGQACLRTFVHMCASDYRFECMCLCACMWIELYNRTCRDRYMCMYMFICIYIYIYIYIMYILYIYIYIYIWCIYFHIICVCMYVMYVCMYVMYVCMYIHGFIYSRATHA